jgi:porin
MVALSRNFGRLAVLVLAALSAVPGRAYAQQGTFWTRDNFTGDWGGARTRLSDKGIDLSLSYTGETFSDLSGGVRRGTSYEDLFRFEADVDLGKLVGWKGGSTHVTVFQIDDSGENAADLTASISDPSNIDALPTTRLFTLWFQQELGKAGSVRIGQLAADDEFLISDTAAALINGTFGWANIVAVNLPGGGPAYPLATPGTRLALNPAKDVSLLAAVFSGDPAGDCPPDQDPQVCNKHGTTFSFTGGALWMGEIQYHPGSGGDGDGPQSYYKLGGWYHTADFADQRLGSEPGGEIVSLAVDPDNPLEDRGNWGVYGVVDQVVWKGAKSSVTLFWRGSAVPADRNLLSWYMDGGFGIAAPFQARPNDTVTFGVAYSNISPDAADLDRDTRRVTGSFYPIRNGETVFELTYIAQLAPWWTLQPDLQYFVDPGGNVPDPDDPNRTIENAFLIGLRTTVAF